MTMTASLTLRDNGSWHVLYWRESYVVPVVLELYQDEKAARRVFNAFADCPVIRAKDPIVWVRLNTGPLTVLEWTDGSFLPCDTRGCLNKDTHSYEGVSLCSHCREEAEEDVRAQVGHLGPGALKGG